MAVVTCSGIEHTLQSGSYPETGLWELRRWAHCRQSGSYPCAARAGMTNRWPPMPTRDVAIRSERRVRCGRIKGLSIQWPQSIENLRLDLPEIKRIKPLASQHSPSLSDRLAPRVSPSTSSAHSFRAGPTSKMRRRFMCHRAPVMHFALQCKQFIFPRRAQKRCK
jgi:hypothetical protein